MKNLVFRSSVNMTTSIATAMFVLPSPTSVADTHNTLNTLTTAANVENIYTIIFNHEVKQSPMGEELDNILFSNQEFADHFKSFSRELDDHLDKEYDSGNINPIKYWRMKRGMTQTELAETIGVEQPHISRWERTKKLKTNIEHLVRIASALDVTVEAMIDGNKNS